MADQATIIAGIKHLAHHFVRTIKEQLDVDVAYDAEAVRTLDAYIEQLRPQYEDGVPPGLIQTMGAFLGECVRAEYGGEWAFDEDNGEWGIAIPVRGGDVWAYPFSKVFKHFLDGKAQSILQFFEALKTITDPKYNWSPDVPPTPSA